MRELINELIAKLGARREKVSHETLQEFETKWNLSLSPFFQALYTEVGNGGYGPGMTTKLPTLEQLNEILEEQARERKLGLDTNCDWPLLMLEFTGYGCSQGTVIDLGEPNNPVYYLDGDGGRGELYDSISAYHDSLESYFRSWLRTCETTRP